jgi:hypothetical protein
MGTIASVFDAHDIQNGKKDYLQEMFDKMREMKTGERFHEFMRAYTMSEDDPINELVVAEELMLDIWNDPEGRFAIEVVSAMVAPEVIGFIGAGLVEAGLSEAVVANVLKAGQLLGGGTEAATEESVVALLEKVGVDVNKYNMKRVYDFYNTVRHQYEIYKNERNWQGYYDRVYDPSKSVTNTSTNDDQNISLENDTSIYNAYVQCYVFGNCEVWNEMSSPDSKIPMPDDKHMYFVDSSETIPFPGLDGSTQFKMVYDQYPDYIPEAQIKLTMNETESIE